MSDIPRARKQIHRVLETDEYQIHPDARRWLNRALGNMYREPAIQNVKRKHTKINSNMRRTIMRMKGKYTIHEIANRVGLRNSGRVSEVLHGKR